MKVTYEFILSEFKAWSGAVETLEKIREFDLTHPGAMNAARQPSHAATKAVTPEAQPAPRLPQTPFQPRSRPRRVAWLTSIAEPMG